MAKGKRTYVAYYSTTTGNMVHMTNINKKNFPAWKKGPDLTKYNKVIRKRESTKDGTLKIKEIKKG
jgi:hypothetical protein